jgi:hypothetical protein
MRVQRLSAFRLSAREQRTLKVGAAVIAFLVLIASAGPRWFDAAREARASAAELEGDLQAARSALARATQVERALREETDRDGSVRRMLIDGETPASAGASLAGLLSSAARMSGVTVAELQVTFDSTPALSRVRVRSQAHGDVAALVRLLRRLESAPQAIRIAQLEISQPAPAASDDTPEVLSIRLTVEALRFTPPLQSRNHAQAN